MQLDRVVQAARWGPHARAREILFEYGLLMFSLGMIAGWLIFTIVFV